MGRLRANFARLGNPMQDCHQWKEPYVTCFPSRLTRQNTERQRRVSVHVDIDSD